MPYLFSPFSNVMFTIMPLIIMVGFVFVFGTIIVRSVQGAKQWKRNNASPVLTVDAVVVTKRADVQRHHHHHHQGGSNNMHHHSSSSTTYYVTFQVASGDRMELNVRSSEYGLLAERDEGKLTFQGTRYLGFERNF